ncbi:MAG: biotin synthase BioB, partial [Rhodococcus sp.]|nr:biotin synthase BioB [Rhodococcus sp. (in: high G+C Gram-positive bacteria)]
MDILRTARRQVLDNGIALDRSQVLEQLAMGERMLG